MKTNHRFHVIPKKRKRGIFNLKIVSAAFILSIISHFGFAQLSITNTDMSMISVGNNQVSASCNIGVSDTTNCSIVEIELKDDLNDVILINHQFQYDETVGLPSGTSWARTGNSIQLALGTFQSSTIWKVRIRLKDVSNNWTSWNEFLIN